MNIKRQFNGETNSLNNIRVYLKRDNYIESIHQAHAVICDSKGRVLMKAGDENFLTFIRSALKPFQVIPFISSGAYEKTLFDERFLAIASGSHTGSKEHSRQAFKLMWNANINIEALQCPIPKGGDSALQHNCSGKHAAFLATCKKMNWTTNDYLEVFHPIQIEIFRKVAELLGVDKSSLITAKDDCGAPTLRLPLSKMAFLYAHLSSSTNTELEQISRSMIRYPDLIAGDGKFDTELVKRGHGQLISKSGSEGIQCLTKVGEGMGIAIKVEDGSKRAKQAVALHVLKQLDWLTPVSLEEMESKVLSISHDLKLEVQGQLRFQEK